MCDRAGWNKQITRSNPPSRALRTEEQNKLSWLMARHSDGLELSWYPIRLSASHITPRSAGVGSRAALSVTTGCNICRSCIKGAARSTVST